MKIINLGILAHVDAGKTTVTEGLLVYAGAKRRMGRVDDGTTTTDSMALERERGMTIRAATVSFTHRDTKINLIDTPGHMDFIAEVERSLAVLDGVVLVVSAKEGVQPQTRVIFEKLRAMRIPTILFVNKIDRVGVSIERVLADIRARLTERIVPVQAAQGEGTREVRLLPLSPRAEGAWERVIEADDALLSRYLAGEAIEGEDIARALGRGIRACALHPVYFGAALHDVGIDALLDAIVEHFPQTPAPADAPLGAYIYKVEWDGHDHKHAYVRVFEGSLDIRAKVAHVGHEEPVYVRGLRAASNGGFVPTGSIGAGDIGVLMDAPHVRCGDFLGREVALPLQGQTSQPLLTMGVTPDPAVGRPALLDALKRLTEEDPILQLSIHPQTEEISLRLYGLLQREIIEALLIERFGIHATFTPARTLYKEKPLAEAFAERRIWSKGNLHAAGIALSIEPAEGGVVEYVTAVSYGDLERSFQNAVEEGARAALAEGLGNEIIGARVTFVDMDYDSVNSTPADYRRLAPEVVRDALRQANLLRLEPWLRYELSAPLESQKRVLAAVNAMRASMDSVLYTDDELRLRGEVPLDTSKGFSAALLSMTQGRGLFSTSFLEYRPMTATQRSGQ